MSPSEAIEEAREALKFYADPNRWPNMPNSKNPHYDMEVDAGSMARRALAALNEVAVSGLTEEERAAIQKDVNRIQTEQDFAAARGVGHPANGDIRTLLRHIERLLSPALRTQIAGEGWRTMESAPVCEAILATCRVKNLKGDQWWETYRIVIDDSTGEIDTDIDQPWSLEDYEFWHPLPAPPSDQETTP
jgi:hypothetical protein